MTEQDDSISAAKMTLDTSLQKQLEAMGDNGIGEYMDGNEDWLRMGIETLDEIEEIMKEHEHSRTIDNEKYGELFNLSYNVREFIAGSKLQANGFKDLLDQLAEKGAASTELKERFARFSHDVKKAEQRLEQLAISSFMDSLISQ